VAPNDLIQMLPVSRIGQVAIKRNSRDGFRNLSVDEFIKKNVVHMERRLGMKLEVVLIQSDEGVLIGWGPSN